MGANGQAGLVVSTLAAGVHSVTASYAATVNSGAGANFQGSSSGPVPVTILLRDFRLSTDASITIQTKHHAMLAVTLASLGGFADRVALSCAVVPMWTSCNFADGGPYALVAGGTVNTEVDIDTHAILNFASARDDGRMGWRGGMVFAMLLPVGLFGLRRERRRGVRGAGWVVMLTICATLGGCSGMQPKSTVPGTYVITMTGKGVASGQVHTATFTVVVTP